MPRARARMRTHTHAHPHARARTPAKFPLGNLTPANVFKTQIVITLINRLH